MLVHVFPGPTPRDVVEQVSGHLGRLGKMPPLWATGYHVCRNTADPDAFVESLAEMTAPDDSTVQRVPFDSDCIDEMLYPTAFHPNEDFCWSIPAICEAAELIPVSDLIQNLTESGKKFVSTQHVQFDPADLGADEDVAFIKILRGRSLVSTDFRGTFNGRDGVVLPDFTNASTSDWWADRLYATLASLPDVSGMTFAHNSPFVKLYQDYHTGCSFTGISYIPEDIKGRYLRSH